MDMETTKKNHKKVNLTSANLSEEQLAQLHRILPEAFSENRIDWDKLRAVLGDAIDERIEKFSFTWAGKSNAIKNVLIPSKATLRPAKDESVMFDESENLFIEGDNLEALKLLQKAYFEKVKMIYIDPPYNTGGDFVYHDDFSAPLSNYLKQTGQKDGNGATLTTNKETSGRYHSDWLSMMYPRLKLAWNLLRDDGVLFVSIDDNEVHHLRMILDEIFGEENFLATFIWKKKGTSTNVEGASVSALTEYIVAYEKSESSLNLRITPKEERVYPFKDADGQYRKTIIEKKNTGSYQRATMQFEIIGHKPRDGKRWQIGEQTARELERKNRFVFEGGIVKLKIYDFEDKDSYSANPNLLLEYGSTESAAKMVNDKIFGIGELFDNPKPVELIQKLVQLSTKNDDLVLDFFAGSGTTAHAVLAQNIEDKKKRRWICVQLPEKTDEKSEAYRAGYKTISDVSKERIRRSIKMVIEEKLAENNGYYNGLREVYGYKEREIKEMQADEVNYIDDGFKIFKLSESNYPENTFEFDPTNTEAENKKAFESYLTKAKQAKLFDDTKAVDVVYENIVKEGLSLNSKVEESKIGKNEVYVVSDGERQLLVCLDKKVDDKTVSELTGKNYKGKVFICLDNAIDDSAKANLGLNVELKTI